VDKYSCQDSQFGRLSYLKWNREQTSSVSELVIALSKRARKRIVDGGLELERALDQVLDQAMESELAGSSAAEEARLRQEMSEHLAAHGPLQPLLDDPEIEEIWINSNSEVFVATLGVSRRLDIQIVQPLAANLRKLHIF
jgi:Flp pilus assembly CpaF family ATPase